MRPRVNSRSEWRRVEYFSLFFLVLLLLWLQNTHQHLLYLEKKNSKRERERELTLVKSITVISCSKREERGNYKPVIKVGLTGALAVRFRSPIPGSLATLWRENNTVMFHWVEREISAHLSPAATHSSSSSSSPLPPSLHPCLLQGGGTEALGDGGSGLNMSLSPGRQLTHTQSELPICRHTHTHTPDNNIL